jgi:predicted porin
LVGVGLTYEYNLSDGFDVKLGAGYEKGSTYAKVQDVKFPVLKFSPHELYNVGAVVTYGNYSIAGSYADAGKSLTNSLDQTKYNMKRQNKLYTAGIAYNQGPVGLSLTYLHNDKYNNKLDAYTLGTQYKIAPGLLQYVEATSFKYSNKGLAVNDGVLSTQSRKLNGMLYILGLKVTF